MKSGLNKNTQFAESTLLKLLERIPFVEFIRKETIELVPFRGVGQPCIELLVLDIDGKQQRIVIHVLKNGQPRWVRHGVEQLSLFQQRFPDIYGVVAAPFISVEGGEICKESGVGYIDLSGNCRISFQHVYIESAGHPNSYSEKRQLRTLYSPKASRIIRVLMEYPRKSWKTQQLANAAGVSLGQVANIKEQLRDRELIEISKTGFRLLNPGQLLRSWCDYLPTHKSPAAFTIMKGSIREIETEVARVCSTMGLPYSLTGCSGFSRYTGKCRPDAAMFLVGGDINRLSAKLQAPGGQTNVTLIAAQDEGVFSGVRVIEDLRIASPTQCLIDMVAYEPQSGAASEELIRIIKAAW